MAYIPIIMAAFMSVAPISERELRDHVRERLRERASQRGAQLFEELSIELGAARVDLALVGQALEGYELKSELDDFARLHNQIHAYNRVFDEITLVVADLHANAALQVTPSWWGVVRVWRDEAGTLTSEVLRSAGRHCAQEARSLAMFLWRQEALEALEEQTGSAAPKRATRVELQERLADAMPLDALRDLVTKRLVERDPSVIKGPSQSAPSDGSSHPVASCSDSRFLL